MLDKLTGPKWLCHIEAVSKPLYTQLTRDPGPIDLGAIQLEKLGKEAAEQLWQTHVCYYPDIHKSPMMYSLPDYQPECPKEWSPKAWTDRTVMGFSPFHVFCPGAKADGEFLNRPFICRISDPPETGEWFYKSIGEESAELAEEMKVWWDTAHSYLEIYVQLRALRAEGVNVPSEPAA